MHRNFAQLKILIAWSSSWSHEKEEVGLKNEFIDKKWSDDWAHPWGGRDKGHESFMWW